MSDVTLCGFISQHISDHDSEIVSELPTANKMYETLHDRHQKQGLFTKIKTIRLILDTVSPLHGTPFCQTFDDISRLHSRYIKMGHLTDDQLLSIFVLNSLRLHPRMQSCYAQALGVVNVGSLLVEVSGRIRIRSGRPSCRASQGQNHGVRRGYRGSGGVRQSA